MAVSIARAIAASVEPYPYKKEFSTLYSNVFNIHDINFNEAYNRRLFGRPEEITANNKRMVDSIKAVYQSVMEIYKLIEKPEVISSGWFNLTLAVRVQHIKSNFLPNIIDDVLNFNKTLPEDKKVDLSTLPPLWTLPDFLRNINLYWAVSELHATASKAAMLDARAAKGLGRMSVTDPYTFATAAAEFARNSELSIDTLMSGSAKVEFARVKFFLTNERFYNDKKKTLTDDPDDSLTKELLRVVQTHLMDTTKDSGARALAAARAVEDFVTEHPVLALRPMNQEKLPPDYSAAATLYIVEIPKEMEPPGIDRNTYYRRMPL